ncbi:MAG: hypothetical protein D4R72_06635 [Nitrosopumilales archaeon]|nr:MAG: hypothetical protein D4R72_06635 [Nitrosopumilales archaeon]
MKIQIAMIFVIFTAGTVISAYGQSIDNGDFSIFVHTNIRDSDGNLIAYQEGYNIQITDLGLLNKLLDKKPAVSTMQKDGKNYEIVQLIYNDKIDSPTVISNSGVGIVVEGKNLFLANYQHDGYLLVKGDTVTSIWTIIRPAR